MAKMTDKKPAKAKPKVKTSSATKAKKAAAAAAAHSKTPASTITLTPAVHQPGVERRKNHPTRSKDGHMQILLTRAVPHLGQPGELVKVRPGFARNYLLPQGMAIFATPHNLRIVEKHRQRLRELEEARRADLLNLAAQIAQRSITIEANANAEGHLYGSVNADQIAAALRSDHFPIDGENVKIEGPLKELGLYAIKLHLGQDVTTEVKLWVVPTHTEEAAT
jgi:large subunit ribosomal protein L9